MASDWLLKVNLSSWREHWRQSANIQRTPSPSIVHRPYSTTYHSRHFTDICELIEIFLYNVLYTIYRVYIMKDEITTVQLNKSVVKALKSIKKYPRETYNEVIFNLIKNAEETKEFDKFVQEAQRTKMKELWEKGDYSGWENA